LRRHISVTAERWLPVREVALSGLKTYLTRLRREGYALIGLEQTNGAVSLVGRCRLKHVFASTE
jgi:tRNA guanosine-2'-O-methyltransferase